MIVFESFLAAKFAQPNVRENAAGLLGCGSPYVLNRFGTKRNGTIPGCRLLDDYMADTRWDFIVCILHGMAARDLRTVEEKLATRVVIDFGCFELN